MTRLGAEGIKEKNGLDRSAFLIQFSSSFRDTFILSTRGYVGGGSTMKSEVDSISNHT
jgi:hypothetical protein